LTRKNEPGSLPLFHHICFKLASTELWVVGGMVAASIVDPRLLPAAVITAAFFWPLRRLAYGRWSVRTTGDFPIILLLLMSVVSWWITPLPQITAPQVYRLWSGIALYYAIVNACTTRQSLLLLIRVFSLGGLALALLAPFSVDWPLGKLPFIPAAIYQRFSVMVADSVHPNVIAGTLALLLPITLAWMLFNWRALRVFDWAIGILSLASMSGVLLLSLSRGAIMAFGAAVLALVVLRWRWGWIAILLALLGAWAGVYWFGAERALEILVASKTVGSFNGRLEVWSRAIDMILDFPFSGIGVGAFQPLADRLYPFLIFAPGQVFHAHNLFLQVAVDLGIPGLIAWLWLLAVVMLNAAKAYRAGRALPDHLFAALGAGLLGSQIALIVHGLTDAVTWGMVRPAPIVWALWGTAIVTALQRPRPQVATLSDEIHPAKVEF
jgi:putative inorganic carbon (HCO3(-)) transporter